MPQWLPSPIRMVELCDGALADARRAFQNWAFEPRPVIPRKLPVKSQSSQGDGNPTQCYVHLVTRSRSTRCPAKTHTSAAQLRTMSATTVFRLGALWQLCRCGMLRRKENQWEKRAKWSVRRIAHVQSENHSRNSLFEPEQGTSLRT